METGKQAYKLMEKFMFIREGRTAGEKRAAHLLLEEIAALGVEGKKENFELDDFVVTKEKLEVLSPYQKQYFVKGHKHSKPTPEDGIIVPLTHRDFLDASWLSDLGGQMVLTNDVACDHQALVDNHVAGLLYMSGSAIDTDATKQEFSRRAIKGDHNRGLVTAFTMHVSDGLEMIALKADKVRFVFAGHTEKKNSSNISVTVPGTEKTDDFIVVGAHYDSVPEGVGAGDNLGGTVLILEMLRHFIHNPPRRSIRFVWFGCEELGMLGSRAYVNAHKDELKNCRVMINIDLAGSTFGRNFISSMAGENSVAALDFLAKCKGYQTSVSDSDMKSDNLPFTEIGIPAICFGRGSSDGIHFIHTKHDTMDYITSEALEATGRFTCLIARYLSDSIVFPFERNVEIRSK